MVRIMVFISGLYRTIFREYQCCETRHKNNFLVVCFSEFNASVENETMHIETMESNWSEDLDPEGSVYHCMSNPSTIQLVPVDSADLHLDNEEQTYTILESASSKETERETITGL